jgi:hypothetical protein
MMEQSDSRLYPSGFPMRALTLTLVCCCSLLSAGCTTTAQIQHQGKPLEQVMADYHSIKKGMTKDEVIAQLGAPNYVEDGVLHWMQARNSGAYDRYASLYVTLAADGKVLRVTSSSFPVRVAGESNSYPDIPTWPTLDYLYNPNN